MSIEALNWALKQIQEPTMPTSTRFVLTILANRADPEGACFPSLRYIAARTGLGERTIREARKELEARGLMLVQEQRRVDGGKTSNHYQLRLDTPPPAAIAGGVGATNAPPPGNQCPTPPATTAGHDTKGLDVPSLKGRGARKTQIVDNFGISERVVAWANQKGYTSGYLQACLEGFISNAKAKAMKYADWDEAFMTWVRREQQFTKKAPPHKSEQPDFQCCWRDEHGARCTVAKDTLRINATDFACEPHYRAIYDKEKIHELSKAT